MPVDLYIAGCMPRPEAVISGLQKIDGSYRELGKPMVGKTTIETTTSTWATSKNCSVKNGKLQLTSSPKLNTTDLIGDGTLGDHTKLLQQHQKPLEALDMRLGHNIKEPIE